jgi:hypothetical protein
MVNAMRPDDNVDDNVAFQRLTWAHVDHRLTSARVP